MRRAESQSALRFLAAWHWRIPNGQKPSDTQLEALEKQFWGNRNEGKSTGIACSLIFGKETCLHTKRKILLFYSPLNFFLSFPRFQVGYSTAHPPQMYLLIRGKDMRWIWSKGKVVSSCHSFIAKAFQPFGARNQRTQCLFMKPFGFIISFLATKFMKLLTIATVWPTTFVLRVRMSGRGPTFVRLNSIFAIFGGLGAFKRIGQRVFVVRSRMINWVRRWEQMLRTVLVAYFGSSRYQPCGFHLGSGQIDKFAHSIRLDSGLGQKQIQIRKFGRSSFDHFTHRRAESVVIWGRAPHRRDFRPVHFSFIQSLANAAQLGEKQPTCRCRYIRLRRQRHMCVQPIKLTNFIHCAALYSISLCVAPSRGN